MRIEIWNAQQYGTDERALSYAEHKVKKYVAELHDTILTMFTKVVQIGDILEWAFEYHGTTGNYQEWVKTNTGLSIDTAGNYRNVARNFRNLDPRVLQAGTLSQFYRLAFDTVDSSAREWFQEYVTNQLDENPSYQIESELPAVARNAPDHVKQRLDKREINIAQADSLTRAYRDPILKPYIASIGKDLLFSDGDVLLAFNRIFIDFENAPASEKPDKTWLDLHHNEFMLTWTQRDGTEREVFLPDANKADFDAYMQFRQARKIAFNAPLRYTATPNNIIVRNGRIILEIDASAFTGDVRQITSIDLIVKETQ